MGVRKLGQIKALNPAFVSVEKFKGQNEFLLVSSFGAMSSGHVYVIPEIADIVNSRAFDKVESHFLGSSFLWPNEVATVPKEVFGEGVNAITVPDGFLPPGKTNGEVFIITTDPKNVSQKMDQYQISTKKSGWFYHMGRWVDMNGDGRLDYLTARTNTKKGELVYFEHPAEGLQLNKPWTEHIITEGPDVMFDL